MKPLKFVCCYMLGSTNKCGKPAPEYFFQQYDGPKPLCKEHAEEYKNSGLEIKRWEEYKCELEGELQLVNQCINNIKRLV